MSNYCIGCKRELAQGQKDCHICGASQSYLKYHLNSILLFTISMLLIAAFGYWYIEQVSLKAKVERNSQITKITSEFEEKISQLELSLAQSREELKLSQAAGSEVSEIANQEKAKLAAAEEKATKAEGRASWLSKENRRFRTQIAELENKVKALEASSKNVSASQEEPPTELPQQEVTDSDNQN